MAGIKDPGQIANYEHYTDSKTFSFAAAQNNVELITPNTGFALRVHDVYVNTAATSGKVELEFTDSGYVFFVFDIASGNSTFHHGMREVGQIDESIRLTTAITGALNIGINWAEVGDAVGSVQAETSTSTSTTTTSTSTTTTSTSTS